MYSSQQALPPSRIFRSTLSLDPLRPLSREQGALSPSPGLWPAHAAPAQLALGGDLHFLQEKPHLWFPRAQIRQLHYSTLHCLCYTNLNTTWSTIRSIMATSFYQRYTHFNPQDLRILLVTWQRGIKVLDRTVCQSADLEIGRLPAVLARTLEEGVMSQGMWVALEAEKRALQPPERNTAPPAPWF